MSLKRIRSSRKPLAASVSLSFALLAACLFAPAPAWADDLVLGSSAAERGLDASSLPELQAEAALALDYDGTEYFSRNADEELKIASITKVMTTIVALDNASPDELLTVSAKAAGTIGSTARLLPGDAMTLETALYGLLVPSGNDAAVAIAEHVGSRMTSKAQPDPEQAFVDAMNAKAAEIGCVDTYFTNPHGLDSDGFESDAHSTARDVAVMVAYAMRYEEFRSIVGGGDVTITVTQADGMQRAIYLETTDELIGVYDGMVGVKTGTGDVALNCFAGACERDEAEVYTVVLKSPTEDSRFSDTAALLDWLYGNYQDVDLISSPYAVNYRGASSPLVAEVACTAWTDKTVDATVADPDALTRIFAAAGEVSQQVSYDEPRSSVKAGDVVGHIDFYQDGKNVYSVELVSTEDLAAPGFFEGLGIWFERLVAGLQGRPSVASSACYNLTSPIMDR